MRPPLASSCAVAYSPDLRLRSLVPRCSEPYPTAISVPYPTVLSSLWRLPQIMYSSPTTTFRGPPPPPYATGGSCYGAPLLPCPYRKGEVRRPDGNPKLASSSLLDNDDDNDDDNDVHEDYLIGTRNSYGTETTAASSRRSDCSTNRGTGNRPSLQSLAEPEIDSPKRLSSSLLLLRRRSTDSWEAGEGPSWRSGLDEKQRSGQFISRSNKTTREKGTRTGRRSSLPRFVRVDKIDQFLKTKMCPFLYEECFRYSNNCCPYAHSEAELRPLPQLQKTAMCRLFMRGECEKDEQDCAFSHSIDNLRHTSDFYKTELCRFWNIGCCNAQDRCRYAHGEQEIQRSVSATAYQIVERTQSTPSLPARRLKTDTGKRRLGKSPSAPVVLTENDSSMSVPEASFCAEVALEEASPSDSQPPHVSSVVECEPFPICQDGVRNPVTTCWVDVQNVPAAGVVQPGMRFPEIIVDEAQHDDVDGYERWETWDDACEATRPLNVLYDVDQKVQQEQVLAEEAQCLAYRWYPYQSVDSRCWVIDTIQQMKKQIGNLEQILTAAAPAAYED